MMATGIFIGIAGVTQSGCRSTRAYLFPASSIPSLIHRFASRRSADSASARWRRCSEASELNRPVLFSLYLAGAIDTWRATGAALPPLVEVYL